MSHPGLCLRTSLGDRAVSRGSPGPIGTDVVRNRRVSPYLVSRVATPNDDTGGTGKVGEPLRDLGTCLEEESTGQPVG